MKPERAALLLRIFRRLSTAYPQEFRNVYGDAMEETAEEAVRWPGAFRLLIDIALTIGSAIGFAGAAAGIRALSAVLSEIARISGTSTADPVLLIGAPVLLTVVALAACYLPARASTRIDPVTALRQE